MPDPAVEKDGARSAVEKDEVILNSRRMTHHWISPTDERRSTPGAGLTVGSAPR